MSSATPPPHSIPATAGLPPLWFIAPEGFFALPIAATPEERLEGASAFVRELYSRGDEGTWGPAAPYYAGIAEMMGASGLSYAAMGLFSTAEEEGTSHAEVQRYEPADGVAQCAFTVGIIPTDQDGADTDVVAQGILAALTGDPYNNAIWVDLPCGPAVSSITLREYTLSPEMAANPQEVKLLTGQIQVHVPFPTGPYTAVFTLYTASMDHWTEIYRLMSAVLQTLSFHDPADDHR
ncbi:hypothetical protein ACGFOM_00510 [Streptomyces sp. NPDC048594]|uniref:hypothetical protein n=1 Tax=Streptomyces sp. NPDC048594 TaxID=3365575 RepID=UPI003719B75B